MHTHMVVPWFVSKDHNIFYKPYYDDYPRPGAIRVDIDTRSKVAFKKMLSFINYVAYYHP